MDRPVRPGDAVIVANTTITLAGLALLGGLLPLMAGGVSTYAAVFRPGADVGEAVASLARAGTGWRLVRILAARPVPILILADGRRDGVWPAALLLPMPAAPACVVSAGR